MRINFHTPKDVRDLIFSLEKLNYLQIDRTNPAKPTIQADVNQLAQEFLVDDQGNTYFLPALLRLSKQEAERSNLRFKTRTGNILSLVQIWDAYDYESFDLIYNQPLVDALVTVNLRPNTLLNPKIPECSLGRSQFPLTSPTISPQGKTYDFHTIHGWLQRNKAKDRPLVDPLYHSPLDRKDILENKALADLIEVNLNECIARRNHLDHLITSKKKHHIANIKAKLAFLDNKIAAPKVTFLVQDIYWRDKLTRLKAKQRLLIDIPLNSPAIQSKLANSIAELKMQRQALRSNLERTQKRHHVFSKIEEFFSPRKLKGVMLATVAPGTLLTLGSLTAIAMAGTAPFSVMLLPVIGGSLIVLGFLVFATSIICHRVEKSYCSHLDNLSKELTATEQAINLKRSEIYPHKKSAIQKKCTDIKQKVQNINNKVAAPASSLQPPKSFQTSNSTLWQQSLARTEKAARTQKHIADIELRTVLRR